MKFKSKVIYTSHIDTPLGGMTMAATDQGLAGVWFDQQRHWPDTTGWIAQDDHPALVEAAAQLRDYFAGRRDSFDMQLDLSHGTAFQQSVWQQLLAIPAGQHHQLWRAQRERGQPDRGARGGRGRGAQPDQRDRALPPRAGRQRLADRLRWRAGAQDRPARAGEGALSPRTHALTRSQARTHGAPHKNRGRMTTATNNNNNIAAKPLAPKAWLIDLVLLGALWGASFLFMRIGAAEFGALPAAAVRVAIAALFLLPIALLRGQGPSLARHWKASFAVGVFNSGMPFALFCFALLTINTGLAAVLNATTPMFGALVAWAWFRERPAGSRIVGLVIGFAGVAMLASRSAGLHAGASGNAALFAVLACLAACLCYGISASATRAHLGGVPALTTATGSQLGATLFLAVPAIWLWPAQMPSLRAWLRCWHWASPAPAWPTSCSFA
jgi:drug/metabolite transporter (DMT)-like permease